MGIKYSLSEVIKAMEKRQQTEDWDVRRDAIYYLKQYEDNSPLTWDELLEMKGKPVWLDMSEPKWIVILNVGVFQDGSRVFMDNNDIYDMKDYGIKWMPYKKEMQR